MHVLADAVDTTKEVGVSLFVHLPLGLRLFHRNFAMSKPVVKNSATSMDLSGFV